MSITLTGRVVGRTTKDWSSAKGSGQFISYDIMHKDCNGKTDVVVVDPGFEDSETLREASLKELQVSLEASPVLDRYAASGFKLRLVGNVKFLTAAASSPNVGTAPLGPEQVKKSA
jgi:hypothetical protein